MLNPDKTPLEMLVEVERWLINHIPVGEHYGYSLLRQKMRRTIARANQLTESAE